MGDFAYLNHSITNILNYVELHKKKEEVLIYLSNGNRCNRIHIRYNGGDISEEAVKNIFDLCFTKDDKVNSAVVGLTLSKSMIERGMGGILGCRFIERESGRYVEFIVTFPEFDGERHPRKKMWLYMQPSDGE